MLRGTKGLGKQDPSYGDHVSTVPSKRTQVWFPAPTAGSKREAKKSTRKGKIKLVLSGKLSPE